MRTVRYWMPFICVTFCRVRCGSAERTSLRPICNELPLAMAGSEPTVTVLSANFWAPIAESNYAPACRAEERTGVPHSKNFILNRLTADDLRPVVSDFSIIELPQGEVLAETHARVEKVYFPHSGIISCVVETIGGGAIETGMIGNDGVFGAIQALDDKVSLNHVVIQVPGAASVISSDR